MQMMESTPCESAKERDPAFGGIRRILVALDGSALAERTLPHALALARAFGAGIVLLRVVGNGSSTSRQEAMDAADWRLKRMEAERYVEDVAARLREAGASVEHATAVGNAAEQILAMARGGKFDVVLVGTHGEGGPTQFRLSSTAGKTVSLAECSILLVPALEPDEAANDEPAYRRVVVPVDGSQRSDWAATQAACIARSNAAELVLLHVVRQPELVDDASPGGESHRIADRLVELNAAAARDLLERQQRSLASPDLPVRCRLESNANAAQIIARVADEEQASLVVVSAHGHSPATGWPYGGCVGALLAHPSRPILVLQDLPQRPLARPRSRAARSARPVAGQPT